MLDSLHPTLLESFAALPEDKPVAFLTRHSIREQPKNGFASYDVPLTEEGILLAEALGAFIKRPVQGFYSSPVQRCMDTAVAMARGLGVAAEVDKATMLVEPGSFVQEIEKVAGLFYKLGPVDFASKHLKNEVRGVLSPLDGSLQILTHLKAKLGTHNEISIHVTHDTILAAFVYGLMGFEDLTEEHWPWMMEGAFVWFEKEEIHLLWRGKHHLIDMPVV
ncbi:MAG: histidine phosphatase family protein [Pseudomonadales bacterium]|nr:histidine phosphatase family protein [Pseudomonadales bacterium]